MVSPLLRHIHKARSQVYTIVTSDPGMTAQPPVPPLFTNVLVGIVDRALEKPTAQERVSATLYTLARCIVESKPLVTVQTTEAHRFRGKECVWGGGVLGI